MLHDGAGRLLFVRHAYGDRRAWDLPGGGAHRGEEPLAAARREAREELGVDVADWRLLGVVHGTWGHKREALTVAEAAAPVGAPLRPDPVELAEVAWFAPARPPAPCAEQARDVLPLVARA